MKTKAEAKPASEALHRVFRERRVELIEQVRAGERSAFEIAAHIADEKPLGQLGVATGEPWPKLTEAVDAYVEWLEKNDRKSDQTARTAKTQLKRFVAFAGAETPVDQITAAKVMDYQRRLYTEEAAQNTVLAYVWRVSGLYTWLARREQRHAKDEKRPPRALDVPIDDEEVTTRSTSRDRFLLEPEAERLIAATPAMLLFPVCCGLLAGMRIDEVVHLRPQFDVDVALGLITVQEQPTWHPKNRKRRVVPMAPQLREVTRYHLGHYASEQWMLPSSAIPEAPIADKTLMRHFKRIVEDAELVSGQEDPRGVVFHTLRHTFASWLVMKGVDLFTVSQLLGNSLKMVEKVYGHLAPDYRQRAVDRLAGVVAIPAISTEGQEAVS